MLWSIDTCQNRASAVQYYLTVPRAQVSTHRGRVFFEVIRWQITSSKWSKAQVYFFPSIHLKYIVFMSLWPRTIKWTFRHFFLNTGGEDLFLPSARVGHALRPISFFSYWSKFDRWVHAEHLCSILKLVYFDSWSWQSFVSTCDVFNCLFPLDVQNEIQLLSRVFCYSWLVCLLGFWLRNASLVKIR